MRLSLPYARKLNWRDFKSLHHHPDASRFSVLHREMYRISRIERDRSGNCLGTLAECDAKCERTLTRNCLVIIVDPNFIRIRLFLVRKNPCCLT